MTKMFDLTDPATAELFERVDPAIKTANESERSQPCATNEESNGCDQSSPHLAPIDELLKVEHWKPAEPQFCKEIAAHYGQGKRTIQKWFVDLREITPWFSDAELRLSDDRYSPLAVDLLGDRYFAGSKKKWAAVLIERFADRVETPQPEPAIDPDVLPPQIEENSTSSGLFLHIGATPGLPSISGLVPQGDDTAYLTKMQQRLQAFERLQQNTIAQMQSQYEQTQVLNAQYQEALSVSDQLLLQEFQLKGVQLGFAALQLKQEAFKSTVQSAEAGTLIAPGKPQAESAPSSV